MPGLQDVTSDLRSRTPQVNVNIDRDKAAALGVNANQIENALYDAYGPRWVSTIYAAVNEYKVLLELEPQYQADPNALVAALLQAPANGPADSARHAGHMTPGRPGRRPINHYGQLPAATISFNLKPGASLGDVGRRRFEDAGRRDAARRRSAPASRAPPRRSRARSGTCGCCC